MGVLDSKTKQAPPADVITTPETGYSFLRTWRITLEDF